MDETIQIRVHGDASRPALIYLPGLHGDWTLIGRFRHIIGDKVRFVEFTYPRTLTWSLDDYAAGVEAALERSGISRGWLLAESYGSQVAWQILARGKFLADGLVLAGGFARHPWRRVARCLGWLMDHLPLPILRLMLSVYARAARFRFRKAPETLADIRAFLARRTQPDRRAMAHRLRLIAENDPRPAACKMAVPAYAITGVLDPIVPWPFVRPWLRRRCTALREYRIVWTADHNVLSTGADVAAQQILKWISAT